MKLTDLPEYYPWASMVGRCINPHHTNWLRYGAKNIRVHDEWIGIPGFLRFREHIGDRPSRKHQIDRIDNDGHYEPGNVKWSTPAEQHRNRSDNIILSFNGETMCATDWASKLGISRQSLHKRLARWPIERALTEPRRARRAALEASNG